MMDANFFMDLINKGITAQVAVDKILQKNQTVLSKLLRENLKGGKVKEKKKPAAGKPEQQFLFGEADMVRTTLNEELALVQHDIEKARRTKIRADGAIEVLEERTLKLKRAITATGKAFKETKPEPKKVNKINFDNIVKVEKIEKK